MATGLTVSYGPTVACNAIDLRVRTGTVHALLGENGAGKSSFVKVLFGLIRPDGGRLSLWGDDVSFHSPADALEAGVGMVQQTFSLAPNLTAEENLALAGPLARRIDRGAVRRAAAAVEASSGLSITYGVPVGELGIGEQQRVEIVRALLTGARLLILDEPTPVLSEAETASLLGSIRRLAATGTTVLLITHRMDDVFAGCDFVTVLRAGRVTLDAPRGSLTRVDLVHAITGDRLVPYERRALPAVSSGSGPVLAMDSLVVRGWKGVAAIDGLSLALAPREVVGVAGVEGNGQRQLCEALTGVRRLQSGSIRLAGRSLDTAKPTKRFGLGLAYVSEDRHQEGLMLPLTSQENYAPGILDEVRWGRFGIAWRRVAERFAEAAARFKIRPPTPTSIVGTLSGGNQQKVVVARAFARRPLCVVASQPTRGVDLGAAEDIRDALVGAAADGAGVLVISADLEELFAICHRIVVLARGRIAWEGPCDPALRREIVAAMTGGQASGDDRDDDTLTRV